MSWYRRTKLVYNSLRSNINPHRVIPESPLPNAFSRIHQHESSNPSAKFSGFSSISSRKIGLAFCGSLGKMNTTTCNPFLNGAKRFYYVDRYQVRHFKPRGPRRWLQNPRTVLTVVLVGSGVLITVYFGNSETVPYTKRKHFVLLSKSMEKRIGEARIELIKAGCKGKILPALHPESIRVRLIAKDIIDALQRGLSHERAWSDLGFDSMDSSSMETDRAVKDTVMALSENRGEGTISRMKWSKEVEILDDKWIQQSRKKGEDKGSKPATSHLEGLNWEVLVVNRPVVNAFCLPGGKIMVSTGCSNISRPMLRLPLLSVMRLVMLWPDTQLRESRRAYGL